MVLSTEWSQVEVINLVNDGSGLGFGIVGGRSTGVVVKSILPGGIADRDGRLQSGDHILQIGEVQTRGLASEHVATILRQCSLQVCLIVARSVEPTSCEYRALGSHAPIVPTKTLTDPEELEALLMQNGYPENFGIASPSHEEYEQYDQTQLTSGIVNPYPTVEVNSEENNCNEVGSPSGQSDPDSFNSVDDSPESENVIVTLEKNAYGLGITVAGYVWEREELSGIFVKGISEGSAAHLSGQIQLNDRIVEVDGKSLRGVTNHEAVEMLRRTGKTVKLSLERYLRGPRYEHLQNALQADNVRPAASPPSPSVTTLSWFPVQTDIEIEPEPESHTTIDSTIFEPPDPDTVEVFVDTHFESGSVTPDLDMIVKKKWHSIVGTNTEIIIAQLRKFRGLGISLEGTVDVEDGVELRPRHFIRSILPEGPVGRNGKLSSGDELLEVNGQKLLGRNHVEVVKILKELPETVRIVCARNRSDSRIINTAQDREGFAARNILSGSLRTLLNENEQQEEPARDEIRSNTSSTATLAEDNEFTEDISSNALVTNVNDSEISLKQIVIVHHANEEDNYEPLENNLNSEFEALSTPTNEHIDVERIDKNEQTDDVVEKEETINEEEEDDEQQQSTDKDVETNNNNNLKKLENCIENSPKINRINSKFNSQNSLIMKRNNSDESDDSQTVKLTKIERRKSRSLEAITYLAVWKKEVEIIELYKGSKGLGFSILDYQDPLDPHGTVIVVRSLVPNGSAELDGRLHPGDRIMSVNETSLKNVSLDEAVRALKSAPIGQVRIGYSKPMPLTKCGNDSDSPINLMDNYFIW